MRVVILGAGQAGGSVARALRSEGHDGPITLIGAEPYAPYERPPLSKGVLKGTETPESTRYIKEEAFAALNLDFRANTRAIRVDRDARTVTLDDGSVLDYDALVFATGGKARRMQVPGAGDARIHALRTMDDALAIKGALEHSKRVAVIGGGWIGLEIAATARSLGLDVTVVEMADRLAGRGAHPILSAWLAELHQSQGVTLKLETGLQGYQPGPDGLALQLSDGSTLTADIVIEGIGLIPEDELAREAGLDCPGGIATDACGRTSDPAIFACGDVALFTLPGEARPLRLESWKNASDQGALTAKAILGKDAEYTAVPWFWSDQYGRNIQILGLIDRAPGEPVRRDAPNGGITWLWEGDGLLKGCVAIDQPMDIKVAQRIMERGIRVERAALADAGIPFKSLMNPK